MIVINPYTFKTYNKMWVIISIRTMGLRKSWDKVSLLLVCMTVEKLKDKSHPLRPLNKIIHYSMCVFHSYHSSIQLFWDYYFHGFKVCFNSVKSLGEIDAFINHIHFEKSYILSFEWTIIEITSIIKKVIFLCW